MSSPENARPDCATGAVPSGASPGAAPPLGCRHVALDVLLERPWPVRGRRPDTPSVDG